MAAAIPWIIPQYLDNNGKPLAGGKVWTYQAGTNTPLASYTDSLGNVPNTNPLILDASGRGSIWLAPGSYKIVLMDKSNQIIWTKDNVKPADGGGGGIVDSDYNFNAFSLRFNEAFSSTGLMDTLTKIIKPGYLAPTISFSASGSTTVREKGAAVTASTLSAAVGFKSNAIAAVRFYKDGSLINTQTTGGAIPNGGTSNYSWTGSITDNTTFSAQADDVGTVVGGPTTVSASANFAFVYPYYYGAGTNSLTPSQVAALTKDVIASTATLTRTITATAGQYTYFAYPASYGALISILDVNGFEVIGSWTPSTINITGLDGSSQSYRQYKGNNSLTAGSYQFTFKR